MSLVDKTTGQSPVVQDLVNSFAIYPNGLIDVLVENYQNRHFMPFKDSKRTARAIVAAAVQKYDIAVLGRAYEGYVGMRPSPRSHNRTNRIFAKRPIREDVTRRRAANFLAKILAREIGRKYKDLFNSSAEVKFLHASRQQERERYAEVLVSKIQRDAFAFANNNPGLLPTDQQFESIEDLCTYVRNNASSLAKEKSHQDFLDPVLYKDYPNIFLQVLQRGMKNAAIGNGPDGPSRTQARMIAPDVVVYSVYTFGRTCR